MHGGNGRLQRVGPKAALAQCSLSQRRSLGDLPVVPVGAVLFLEPHRVACCGTARGVAGVVPLHPREQAHQPGLAGHQAQRPAHPADRLNGQLAAQRCRAGIRQVAFAQDQVDHPPPAGQTGRPLGQDRLFVRDASRQDLGLGAHGPLCRRRCGDQEGRGDGLGRQTAARTQRDGDAHLFGQAGVAAGKDQAQAVAFDVLACVPLLLTAGCLLVGHRCGGFSHGGCRVDRDKVRLSPHFVDGLEAAHGYQPDPRVGRHAWGGPLLGRGDKGAVQRFFGGVHAAQQAHQRR